LVALSLADLALRTSYHKGQDDIAEDFYLPCMRRAVRYDRAVGFFQSTVFGIAWPALRTFVEHNGTMRILCSHVLSEPDAEALSDGYAARLDAEIEAHFLEEVRALICEPHLQDPVRILAALVATGVLELKVAILTKEERNTARGRLFHDKLGIFRDHEDNAVIFKGSMNETWSGLAADGNLESVDVAATWLGVRDRERADTEMAYFETLWSDTYPGLSVKPFPQVARDELERVASSDWRRELQDCLDAARSHGDPRGRTLRPHQTAGLASWRAQERRGVLEFATGSGKTFTAISAIRDSLVDHGEIVFVIVPDRVLLDQWYTELRETTADLDASILRAGAGYVRWKGVLQDWTDEQPARRVVVATIQTASSPGFLRQVRPSRKSLLVVDEVHRAGSPHHRRLLDEDKFGGARLGLSATPERAGDPVGTDALRGFFGGILEPRYTLADAIRDGVLCRYFYRPHTVALSQDERAEWADISRRIRRLVARQETLPTRADVDDRLKLLFIERSRVVKQAAAKVDLAVAVLSQHAQPSERWLVYCDNLAQLNEVCAALAGAGITALPFHSQMDGDRMATLRWLDEEGGVVVAIKCLDEGVDVPSVSHALILASSKNPREFIQRRGRVLRRAPGKSMAFVHDAIVIPPERTGDEGPDPITAGELARAVGFAQAADNPSAGADLQKIAIDMGIDWQSLHGAGIEVDDDDSD